MNKGIKYALMFTGGVVIGFGICGYKTIKYAFNDEYIRKALCNKLSGKIDNTLYRGYEMKKSDKPYYYRITDNLLFDSRKDAEEVIYDLAKIIDMYGCVSVADLYDLADLPAPYTSNKYGWISVKDFRIRISKNYRGYVLETPEARPIK